MVKSMRNSKRGARVAIWDSKRHSDGPVKPKKLIITRQPNKLEYLVSEAFEPAGLELELQYTDGSSEHVSDYTYEPLGALTLDDTTVTVTHLGSGLTATIAITVTEE